MEDKSKLYEKIEFLGEGQVRKLDTWVYNFFFPFCLKDKNMIIDIVNLLELYFSNTDMLLNVNNGALLVDITFLISVCYCI